MRGRGGHDGVHKVRGKAWKRLHCGKGRRPAMANSCQLVHKPYAEWLLAARAGRANHVASAMNAVTPLSTGKGEVWRPWWSTGGRSARAVADEGNEGGEGSGPEGDADEGGQRDGGGSEGAGGGRDNGEGSGRSDGVAVTARIEPHSRRREWSSGKSHRSKLGAGWRGLSWFFCSSRPTHLPAQPHAPRTHL